MELFSGNKRKVLVGREEVRLFRAGWPCVELRDRSYWFEFAADGDLVDCDVPEHDDGTAAATLAGEARAFFLANVEGGAC